MLQAVCLCRHDALEHMVVAGCVCMVNCGHACQVSRVHPNARRTVNAAPKLTVWLSMLIMWNLCAACFCPRAFGAQKPHPQAFLTHEALR